MAKSEAVVLSAANLDLIENNIGQLANNVGQISLDVVAVDDKVTNVTESVRTIEEEIKSFMLEIRGSTITANARQSIMQSEAEIQKRFGHYDGVRRKISGLLQATDMSAITKSSVKEMSEQIVVDTPDYWLAPALVALSAWLIDDKELAERALKEAMNRDDEKTSLLFSLIHARAGRIESSTIWLKRYLDMQDPLEMEAKIIVVLEAISAGVFGSAAKDMALDKINQWLKELKNFPELKEAEVNRFKTYISDYKQEENESYPYVEKFSDGYEDLKQALAINKGKVKLFDDLVAKFDAKINNNDKTKKIDELVLSLVFNYENEELDLRREIARNKLIIEEGGNIKKADQRFKDSELAYNRFNNFYSLFSNVALGHNKASSETVKLAISLSKDFFLEAYEEVLKDNHLSIDKDINIKIDDWTTRTKNASDEKELKKELQDNANQKMKKDLNAEPLFNMKMLLSVVIGIIAIFLTISNPIIAIIILTIVMLFNIYQLATIFVKRKEIENQHDKMHKEKLYVLMNTVAEIVDYKLICEKTRKIDENLSNYLKNLDYKDFVKSEASRNIVVGGAHE